MPYIGVTNVFDFEHRTKGQWFPPDIIHLRACEAALKISVCQCVCVCIPRASLLIYSLNTDDVPASISIFPCVGGPQWPGVDGMKMYNQRVFHISIPILPLIVCVFTFLCSNPWLCTEQVFGPEVLLRDQALWVFNTPGCDQSLLCGRHPSVFPNGDSPLRNMC